MTEFGPGFFSGEHEHEESKATLKPIAAYLYAYYRALIEIGFEERVALKLTQGQRHSIWLYVMNKPSPTGDAS